MKLDKVWITISAIILTLLACYFPLCHRIDSYCIQPWDESRNVVNAMEMLKNHDWFIRYFDGKPDMWELKPPFLIWCQVLSIKLFGLSELAIRFPSMVFSMGTVLLLIWLSDKITGKIYAGIIAALILVSSQGYIGMHVARFGDHDVVLTFFSTALLGFFYLFLKTNQTKYLTAVFIALFLGWFTKSIIIFMFLPGLFIWLVANKKLKKVVFNKSFWIGTFIISSLIISYYLLREKASPDYIYQVWMNELFGRYFDASPNYHYAKNEFWYYLKGFIDGRFWPFILVFLPTGIWVLINKKVVNRNFILFLLINIFIFFLIISAGTKNLWYDASLYPLFSLFLGVVTIQLYNLYKNTGYRIAFIFVCLIFLYPSYFQSVQFAIKRDVYESAPMQSLCYFLKDENHKLPEKMKILYNETDQSPLYFYIEKAKKINSNIALSTLVTLQINDAVLLNENYKKDSLEMKFTTELITADKGCEIRKLVALK